ncbi:MAG: hypothetical protein ACHQNV_04365, partial [Vicinamibacteria bacterium]
MKGRRVRLALGVVAIGAALLAAGLFPQEPLRRFAEGRLRAALGPGAHLGRLHVVPGTLRVEADDLTIEATSFSVSVRHLDAYLAPGVIVGTSLAFRELSLAGARIAVRPSTGRSSAAWTQPVTVDRLGLTDGSLFYGEPSVDGSIEIHGLEAHGAMGSGFLDLSFANGSWKRTESAGLSLAPSQARLRISSTVEIEVESAELSTAASQLSAKGHLGRPDAFAPRLDLGGHVDLAEASRVAAVAPLAGRLTLTAHVDSASGPMRANGTLDGTRLLVAGWPIEGARVGFVYDGSASGSTKVTLSSSALGGHAKGEAVLQGRTLEAQFQLEAVDLSRVAAHAGSDGGSGSLSGELRLSGSIDGPLEAKMGVEARVLAASAETSIHADAAGTVSAPGLWADLSWKATVDGGPVAGGDSLPRLGAFAGTMAGTARGPWPPDLEGEADLRATLVTADGPLATPLHAAVRSHGSTASVVVDARPFSGTLHAEADVSGPVLSRSTIRAENVDLAPLSPHARGRVWLAGDATGPWRALSGHAAIRAEALGWDQIDLGSAKADVRADQGSAHVAFALPDWRMSGDATLPVEHEARGSVALAETPLAPLAPLLTGMDPLEGVMSGTLAFQIPIASPSAARGQGDVSRLAATSGRFRAEAMRTFHVSFERGRLGIDGLSLRGPGYALSASGLFGLAPDSPLEGQLSLEADLASVPAPEAWTLSGRVRGDLAASGTRSDPRVNGDVAAADVIIEGPALPPTALAQGHITLDGTTLSLAPAKL